MGGWAVHADGAVRPSLLAADHAVPAFVVLRASI
jgi:hypothetical protein